MTKVEERFLLSCEERPSLALKWFWPAFRTTNLPFLVTLILLRYDLLLFMLFRSFDDHGHPFGALLGVFRDLVGGADEAEDSVDAFPEELRVEILGAAGEEEVYFDPVAFSEPFGGFLGLELEIVLSGANFNLYLLHFYLVRLGLSSTLFLVLFVLELTIIRYFCNGRDRHWGDLDEVESGGFCLLEGLGEGHHAAVLSLRPDEAYFR